MTTSHHHTQDSSFEQEDGSGLSLREIARAVRRRRRAIAIALGLLALTYVIAGLSLLLLQSTEKLTSIAFRLEFRGADRGQYPNGTKFNPAEIIGTPVLLQVYRTNELDQFLPFAKFRSSLFVLESNAALEQLTRAYAARLASRDLTQVERDNIEKEFSEKKESLTHNDYSLNLLTKERMRAIPSSLRAKILSDILRTWAEEAVADKGVALYDLSILSSGIFERDALDSYDYVIALAMVRSKINRVLANIDELVAIPGAKVVRTPKSNVSLAELRVRLEDVLNFKVEPLVGSVMSGGLSKTPEESIKFLETQLTFNELARQEAASRAKTLRETLATYVEEQGEHVQERGKNQTDQPLPNQTVIPQIGDTFLDRLVSLTSKDTDTKFRQELVDEMKRESLKVVPLEAEANYYRTLLASLRGVQSRARAATPAEHAAIKARLDAAINEAIATTDQVNEIYSIVSKNLNPSTVLYTAGAPRTTTERPLSSVRLALFGLLLFCLALPSSVAVAVIFDRISSGKGLDEDEIIDSKLPVTRDEIEAV